MPARFVIGDGGRVFYADVSVDHTQRPELENLIAAIDAARDAAL
jgi:hypothetical protein